MEKNTIRNRNSFPSLLKTNRPAKRGSAVEIADIGMCSGTGINY